MFNFTNFTAEFFAATFSTIGASIRHGPHQGAQKSTRTGLSEASTSVENVLCETSGSALIAWQIPPPVPTLRDGDRLRVAEPPGMRSLLAASFVALLALPAAARTGVNVLVGADVSPMAQSTMPSGLWSRLVAQWVGENVIPASGSPTLDDCARAKALYMVNAPFELKPRLPGTALHVNDRVAGLTHVTVVNCLTKKTVYDQLISLESNPVSTANAGDLEPVAAVTWESSVKATLRAHPLVFATFSRVIKVAPPFVYIDGGTKGLAIGQTLRIYAGADGVPRNPAVVLTIVDVAGRQIEARYDATNPNNKVEVGDLVEPYAGVAPR